METDDRQVTSPTLSDHDRPRPTTSDHVGHGPTMQDKRREDHTLTTREVMQLFEEAGLSRNQRSIERYCDQGKLDCFKDPDELRYYITRASAERLIGHLKELEARHQQVPLEGAYAERPTGAHAARPGPTPARAAAGVKQTLTESSESDTAREAYEHK